MSEIFEERKQLREDLLARKTPKRLPMTVKFLTEAACQFAGIDMKRALYDPEMVERASVAICENFYSDALPVFFTRFPWSFQLLASQSWVVGSSGAVQHPEVENMKAEWYDEFIADPVATIIEKIVPNACKALDVDPVSRSSLMTKVYAVKQEENRILKDIGDRLSKKYGYMTSFMDGPTVPIPFDNLADKYRGFKGIMMDMRRVPEKVKAAVDALFPIAKFKATSKGVKPGTVSFLPLHMPPYISTKAFEEFYWPTFEGMVLFMDELGVLCNVFAEGDWSRYYEHMARLPGTTSFQVEEGDWAKMKSTFGREHVFGGLYDPTITLTRTKEQCVDEAKRLFDTCGEGGRFYFCFNRSIMDIKSVDVPKLQAVLEWVRTKAVY
jgi:hypothetical protein